MRGGYGYEADFAGKFRFLKIYFYNKSNVFILGRGPRIFRGRGGPMLGGPMGPMPGPMGPPMGGK